MIQLIPELLELYYSGKFPIDKISKCYPAENLYEAIEDLKLGRVSDRRLVVSRRLQRKPNHVQIGHKADFVMAKRQLR